MDTVLKMLIGLVVGYIVGIILGAVNAFVLDVESAARFVAIGCGLLGAILCPTILDRLDATAK